MTGTVGLLHPGEMGAELGRLLVERGRAVLWASEGRSAASAGRARKAGLTDAGTAAGLARHASVLLSVCPPAAAVDVASSVPDYHGTYVDCNAVAPATIRSVAARVASAGCVDGGLVGPPPRGPGTTRLYLSGPGAAAVAALFEGTRLAARVVGPAIGAASAVKAAYAGWTKGSAALLLAVRSLARAEGVEDALLAEWALSQPELARRCEAAARSAAAKGWRWDGEMTEIAAALDARGLPPGFGAAAAEVFRRAPRHAESTVDDVLDAVLRR